MEKIGSPSWYLDALIYAFPVSMTMKMGIKLLVYGEDVNYTYGGKLDSETPSAAHQVENDVVKSVWDDWFDDNEISEQERPITEFHIKRIYPPGKNDIVKLTPDQMLEYLEFKVQQHIPTCSAKNYLLKRITTKSEHNTDFKRLNNYVKLLSK